MNYIIENNINFFDELKKELSIENNKHLDTNDNICLISNEILKDNFITLSCNHKFNYLPLYNEVINQKNYTGYALEITHLLINQIKCPYCRTITNKLLPYIEELGIQRKRGVNYPSKYCMKLYNCQWNKSSKNKCSVLCNKEAYKTQNGIYCNTHQKLVTKKQNKLDNKSVTIHLSDEYKAINKKYKVVELKQILRDNKKLIGGTKSELINTIIHNNLNINI